MNKLTSTKDVGAAAQAARVIVSNGSVQQTANGQLINNNQTLVSSSSSIFPGLFCISVGTGDRYLAFEYPLGPLGEPSPTPVLLIIPNANELFKLSPGTWVWGMRPP